MYTPYMNYYNYTDPYLLNTRLNIITKLMYGNF